MKVIYDPPPIPDRQFDYQATWGEHDLGAPVGFGRTEAEAIADLRENTNDG